MAPRILASRTAFIADSQGYALQAAEPGLSKQAAAHRAAGHEIIGDTVTDYARQLDAHIGDAPHVLASLAKDSVLTRVTDISFRSIRWSHRIRTRCVLSNSSLNTLPRNSDKESL